MRLSRPVLASILGTSALIGSAVVGLPVTGILVCGAISGAAGWILGSGKRTTSPGIQSSTQVREQIRLEAQQTLDELASESHRLPPSLKEPVARIAKTAQEMQENLGTNALELAAARRFISEYLKNTLTIVRSYNDLKQKGSDRLQQVEPELGKLLLKVDQGFVKQKQQLLADDALRLEVEMKVLEQTIENEG